MENARLFVKFGENLICSFSEILISKNFKKVNSVNLSLRYFEYYASQICKLRKRKNIFLKAFRFGEQNNYAPFETGTGKDCIKFQEFGHLSVHI